MLLRIRFRTASDPYLFVCHSQLKGRVTSLSCRHKKSRLAISHKAAAVEAAGIEPGPKSTGNSGVGDQSGAECGALGVQSAPIDPDLRAVIEHWPALPEAIKAGILAMIRAAE